jgi:hypothetical protein
MTIEKLVVVPAAAMREGSTWQGRHMSPVLSEHP